MPCCHAIAGSDKKGHENKKVFVKENIIDFSSEKHREKIDSIAKSVYNNGERRTIRNSLGKEMGQTQILLSTANDGGVPIERHNIICRGAML